MQVHIGNGQFVPNEKLHHLMRVPRDSLFCKEGARSLWTAAQLKDRSLTALPSRHFLTSKQPPAAKKLAMTPTKVDVLECTYML